jgi:hypothetical protein
MKLKDVIKGLDLTIRCGEGPLETAVSGAYAGDLLSDVIANSKPGNVWITMQLHVNIVAVAVLKGLSAIIIVQGREPAADTLRKAAEEHVTILVSKRPAFETAGKLYAQGVGTVP